MKIVEKLLAKHEDHHAAPPVTVAFLGDSVTQGCFECYYKNDGTLETVYDYDASFACKLRRILNYLYPSAQINIINSGISGDSAPGGAKRFERDVAAYRPDLVVVAFGLNDCGRGQKGLADYLDALRSIFSRTKALGAECIFLTPNLMATEISPHLPDARLKALAQQFVEGELNAKLELYISSACRLADEFGVPVCDVYAKWKAMAAAGVDITELLANKLNHPRRELTTLTAMSLAETMFMA